MKKTIAQMKAYFPKPTKGQSFPGFVKIDIRQAVKYILWGQKFDGFIVGNKVHSFHFLNGWHLACPVETDNSEDFKKTVQQFSWYMDREIGTNVAIYLKIPRKMLKSHLELAATASLG